MADEYVFVDEWDVDASRQAVYDAVSDPRTYPDWWKPVYISVEGDDRVTHHHFKGRLPYTLKMRSELVSSDPPNGFEVKVDGDLRGKASGHSRNEGARRTSAGTGSCSRTSRSCVI
jgi:hypothetical protein